MSAATPEWAELLQEAVAAGLLEVHTSMPGQVVAVHDGAGKRQFVDVRLSLRRALEADEESAEPFVEEELPILPRVPVGFPQGGGWFVSFPLKPGDFVYVVFAERSLDRFIATARKAQQKAISTGDIGTHSLDGAFALPNGPAPKAELLEGVSGTDLVIGHVSGTPLMKMAESGTVTLTGDLTVTGSVTAAEVTATEVTAGGQALSTHVHSVPSFGSSGPPIAPPTGP